MRLPCACVVAAALVTGACADPPPPASAAPSAPAPTSSAVVATGSAVPALAPAASASSATPAAAPNASAASDRGAGESDLECVEYERSNGNAALPRCLALAPVDRSQWPKVDLQGDAGPQFHGEVVVVGASTAAMPNLERILTGLRPKFRACYRKEIEQRPNASGVIRISLSITATGEVAKATVFEDGGFSPNMTACASRALGRAQFDSPAGGVSTVRVDVRLLP